MGLHHWHIGADGFADVQRRAVAAKYFHGDHSGCTGIGRGAWGANSFVA